MTKVEISRDIRTIKAMGHAESGISQGDPVCSAVSMLLYALGEFAYETGGAVSDDDARMVVSLPDDEDDEYVAGGFDAIALGIKLLSEAFPNSVRVTE